MKTKKIKKIKEEMERAKKIWDRIESYEKIINSIKGDFFFKRQVKMKFENFLNSIPC